MHPDGRGTYWRGAIGLWAVLLVIWAAVNGSLAPVVMVAGLAVTGAIALPLCRTATPWTDLRLGPRAILGFLRYTAIFLREMVRANLGVMRVVYAPRIDIRPGIVPTRVELTAPMARFVLANTVSLTPGSLVLELKDESLSVHLLDRTTTDVDINTAAVSGAFQPALARTFG
ncbi:MULTISPECIES: Na+/H+ antiporter subunit E [Meridianimarinicoccus]|uniref:Na+/H+ antiporter subunit E n=1 Tax=Meridianimarinicoccus zhengii TaxID=2056810 RepID=UPI000DAD7A29|nr:Na+/H+ antiporter subunit E [Phycocomes zhengii]